jgi:hypothetical protein
MGQEQYGCNAIKPLKPLNKEEDTEEVALQCRIQARGCGMLNSINGNPFG